jgi:hypothetical protein
VRTPHETQTLLSIDGSTGILKLVLAHASRTGMAGVEMVGPLGGRCVMIGASLTSGLNRY